MAYLQPHLIIPIEEVHKELMKLIEDKEMVVMDKNRDIVVVEKDTEERYGGRHSGRGGRR